jgi:NAD(P)-dependent dehydrogenase (short-subunit alcohol dehydrogenase family)
VVPSFTRLGIATRRRLERWQDPPPMAGSRVVITGATSGIGLAAAVAMARHGALVHLVGRDLERGARARELVAVAGGRETGLDLVDLSDLDAVAALGARLLRRYETIDVLVHNAGSLGHSFAVNPSGVERTVATQVLCPYVLTAALLPALRRGVHPRVVTVSSGGMYTQKFDLATLEMNAANFRGSVAYARAKRAQVVLAAAWAQRFGEDLASYSMHPGWVDTPGLRSGLPGFASLLRPLLRTPDEGADTIVYLASGAAEEQYRQGFFFDRSPRPQSRLFGSVASRAEGDALLDWCAIRTGVMTPRPRRGGAT